MQERLVDKLSEPFKLDTPLGQTMAMKIESVLGVLKGKSRGLSDTSYFVNRHWAELFDDPSMVADVIVMFRSLQKEDDPLSPGLFETYKNGELTLGRWRNVGEGRMSISQGGLSSGDSKRKGNSSGSLKLSGETVLYGVAFLDEDFIILKRHGNLPNDAKDALGSKRYRLFIRDGLNKREKFEWDDALEFLLNKYRGMAWYYIAAVILAFSLMAAMLLLSN
ncbi:MAG: hypothetical protein AAF741_01725 [Bacteroidota bacterium]